MSAYDISSILDLIQDYSIRKCGYSFTSLTLDCVECDKKKDCEDRIRLTGVLKQAAEVENKFSCLVNAIRSEIVILKKDGKDYKFLEDLLRIVGEIKDDDPGVM